MSIRILLTCRLGQTNQHDFARCLAGTDSIDLYVLTDSATYPDVPGLESDSIYHYHPTWPVLLSRFHPYDKRRYREFLDEIEPDILLSLAVSHLAFLGPTVDFHPTVFLPQGGKMKRSTLRGALARNAGILRWIMYRPLMWNLLRHVDEVWSPGPNQELLQYLGMPEEVFVDFDWGLVDMDRFRPQSDPKEFVEDPEVTVIGTFRRARNPPLIPSYETFLDGVSILAKRRDDFHVIIGGLYPDDTGDVVRRAIEDRIDDRDLTDRVTKIEMVPKKEMPRYYAGLDVYVDCSPKNGPAGIGTASKEAMATECAYACFDEPSKGWVIDQWENGIRFSHGDPECVADALEKLVADKKLRANLGRAARDTVRDRFACTAVSERVVGRSRLLIS